MLDKIWLLFFTIYCQRCFLLFPFFFFANKHVGERHNLKELSFSCNMSSSLYFQSISIRWQIGVQVITLCFILEWRSWEDFPISLDDLNSEGEWRSSKAGWLEKKYEYILKGIHIIHNTFKRMVLTRKWKLQSKLKTNFVQLEMEYHIKDNAFFQRMCDCP